jgi:hypothetical protein
MPDRGYKLMNPQYKSSAKGLSRPIVRAYISLDIIF